MEIWKEVTNLTSCFPKHLKVTSLNAVLCVSRMTNLLGVPITRSSDGGEIKVAASGPPLPNMAFLRVLKLLRRYGSLQLQRRRG